MIRRVGQSQDVDIAGAAGKAAGDSARTEAEKGVWPPKREQAAAIGAATGAAAGGAACAAIGAEPAVPLCAAIGGEVGELVGGALYDVLDSWFGSNDLTRRTLDSMKRRATLSNEICKVTIRLAELASPDNPYKGEVPGSNDACRYNFEYPDIKIPYASRQGFEYRKLKEWGLPSGRGYTWDLSDEQFKAQLKRIWVAESARTAEIVTQKELLHTEKRSGLGMVVVLGAVSAVGVGLLQKLVTRGKL